MGDFLPLTNSQTKTTTLHPPSSTLEGIAHSRMSSSSSRMRVLQSRFKKNKRQRRLRSVRREHNISRNWRRVCIDPESAQVQWVNSIRRCLVSPLSKVRRESSIQSPTQPKNTNLIVIYWIRSRQVQPSSTKVLVVVTKTSSTLVELSTRQRDQKSRCSALLTYCICHALLSEFIV